MIEIAPENVQKAFGFNETDYASNVDGKISPRQKRRLIRKFLTDIPFLSWLFLGTPFIVLFLMWVSDNGLRGEESIALGIVAGFITLVMFAFLAGLILDLRSGDVRTIHAHFSRGTYTKWSPESFSNKRYRLVGTIPSKIPGAKNADDAVAYHINRKQYETLPENGARTALYASKFGNVILSMGYKQN